MENFTWNIMHIFFLIFNGSYTLTNCDKLKFQQIESVLLPTIADIIQRATEKITFPFSVQQKESHHIVVFVKKKQKKKNDA